MVIVQHVLRAILIGALTIVCLPAAAWAGPALVDDPNIADKIPPKVKAYFAECEAEYQAWLNRCDVSTDSYLGSPDAPHRCLGTTSHRQSRNDFCVPTTTAIIDHFLRGADEHWGQTRWSEYEYEGSPLWTDAGGGNMWVMAMGLKAKTGEGYKYTSGNTKDTVYRRTEHAIQDEGHPVAYGVKIIQKEWRNYRIDHAGHILCGRGFDWRRNTIHVDDPYPENAPPPLGYGEDGGDTYGHKTYPKATIAGGVVDSASQQVVF